ncbi:NUDIX hydrolase [Mycoplasma sp. HS2188]|uniref:NUDIX hydrolase n=1 Tax=Mycoplasma sp. HS2188 TaxID=2976765 RepID=UPI0021AAFD15|nr:NUDIX hydrolase [Mycoplasma sp. HS2188]MCT4469741.1 NUDIX hydrolase [Mycoplasma sp. HS2188]
MNKNEKLFSNEWMSVYKSQKGFTYCQRKSVDSIAALLYRHNGDQYEFMIHYQPLPEIKEKISWDQCYPSPVTGSIEENQLPIECCINEINEEAGYKITAKNIVSSSVAIATTQMNEKVFNFLVDVSGLKQGKITTDGSVFESVSYNKWYSQNEFANIVLNELTLSSLSSLYLLFLTKNK